MVWPQGGSRSRGWRGWTRRELPGFRCSKLGNWWEIGWICSWAWVYISGLVEIEITDHVDCLLCCLMLKQLFMRLLYMIQVCACIVFTYRCHYMSIFMFYIGSSEVFKEFVSCVCPFWANKTRGLIYWAFWFSLFCLGEIAMNYMCSLTLNLMSITIVWNFHRQAVKFITIHQNQTIVCLLCFRIYFFARKHWNWRNVHSVPCFTNSGFIFVVCSHSFLEGIEEHLSTFISGIRSCDPLVT